MTRFGDQAPRSATPAAPRRPWPPADSGQRDAWNAGAPGGSSGWDQPAAPPTMAQRRPADDWSQARPATSTGGTGFDRGSDLDVFDEPGPGRPAWAAVLVMVAITTVGVIIDVVRDATGGVNYAIIVGALVAILVVRRVSMFPVVIAPPLVYLLGSAAVLYLRSGGPHNKSVLIDIATNWLVYGFPAMAAATIVVLVIAGIRMLIKR